MEYSPPLCNNVNVLSGDFGYSIIRLEPTCKYLNVFTNKKASGRKSVVALRGVNRHKRFYQDAKGMIRGRAIIYVLLGLLA